MSSLKRSADNTDVPLRYVRVKTMSDLMPPPPPVISPALPIAPPIPPSILPPTPPQSVPQQVQPIRPGQITEEIKLGLFDTLHDFWKERKLAKNDDEDEDNEEMDESKQDQIRAFLVDFLKKFTKIQNITSINQLLSNISNNNVTSVTSNYERTVLNYYEKYSSIKNDLYENTMEALTYGDIIRSYKESNGNPLNNKILQKYILSNGSNYILDISCGDDDEFNSFGVIQKNPTYIGYIANFILNYYFPNVTTSSYNAYITFDAKTGIVGKTFRDITDVSQLVTPANIADSAVTTFKALNNRNSFYFPNNQWQFNSNYYTMNENASIYFTQSTNNKFNEKNQFGFELNINNNGIQQVFPFSSKQKQGPSVNYLVDLIVSPNTAKPNVSSILNINSLTRFDNLIKKGLLFDLKRGGDYEQVNVAKQFKKDQNGYIIFSTIDILCSLYARTQKQNTIWHNGEKIILYRFPTLTMDPILQSYYNIRHKSITMINECELLKKILNPDGGIVNDIIMFNQKILNYWNNGVYVDNSRKKGIIPVYSEVLINTIIKIRILDLIMLFNNINNIIDTYKRELQIDVNQMNRRLDDMIRELKLYSELDIKTMSDIDIDREKTKTALLLDNIYKILPENIINQINTSFNLTPNEMKILKTGGNPLGLDYIFYTESEFENIHFFKFKYTGNSTQLNFSNKFYSTLYDTLNKFDRMVNSSSRYSKTKDLYKNLHRIEYFTLINTLYDTFYNKELGETIYNMLQPDVTNPKNIGDTDEKCENWWKSLAERLNVLLGDQKQIIIPILPGLDNPMLTLGNSMSGGSNNGHIEQFGGLANIIQIYNLSDLLRNISGTAAQFVESLISETILPDQPLPSMNQLIELLKMPDNFKICVETMNDIKFLLSDGLMTIQNDSTDDYEYDATPEEFILLYFMSITSSMGEDVNNSFESLSSSTEPIPSQLSIQQSTNELRDDYYLNMNMNFYGTFLNIINNPMEYSPTGRGYGMNVTQINDIYSKYLLSDIPAEIINLLLLTLFDNTMQNINKSYFYSKQGYFINLLAMPSNGFSSISDWSSLFNYFYVFINLIITGQSGINPQIRNILGGKKRKTIRRHKKNKKTKNIKKKTLQMRRKSKNIKMKHRTKRHKGRK